MIISVSVSYTSIPSVEKHDCEKEDWNIPQDRFFLLRILFFLMGVVTLMPLNFLGTANQVSNC